MNHNHEHDHGHFFHYVMVRCLQPTFLHRTGDQAHQRLVPTPTPWNTPLSSPRPVFHHWRGGISETIDQFIFVLMILSCVFALCTLLRIWFRVRQTEIDFQHTRPLRHAEDGTGAEAEEMQQFIREPAVPSSSGRRGSTEEAEEEDFIVGGDSDDESPS